MAYWLFKSEPDAFSWDQLKSKGEKGQEWDGVRNYAARNNMRLMEIGDGPSQIGAFFRELLPRLGHVELAGPPAWVETNFVSGLKRLPIRYAFTKAAA